MKFYEYKKITFPIRECNFTYKGKTLSVTVGSDLIFNGILTNKDGEFRDNEAEYLDSLSTYTIPHDMLISGTDDEIFNHIVRYVDPEIVFIFR